MSLSAFASGEMIVTLEQPDGTVWRGKCYATEIAMSQEPIRWTKWMGEAKAHAEGPLAWSMALQGSGDLTMSRGDVRLKVAIERAAAEWRCEYCGAIGVRAQRQCPACGAWRSFLYEEE